MKTVEEAIKTLKEICCTRCPYGSQDMDSCDIRGCDEREAIKTLEQGHCEDCVSRQAVIDMTGLSEWFDSSDSYNEFVIALSELPPVVPQPKTGYWIEENINEWSRKIFCSECGCPPPFEHVSNGDVYSASGYGVSNKTRFCPNCGADMRGVQE